MRSTNFRSIVEPRFQEGGTARPIGTAQLVPHQRIRTGQADAIHAALDAVVESSASDTGPIVEAQMVALFRETGELTGIGGRMGMRFLAKIGGKELVEEKMNETAREKGELGGRVVEYSGGALEWVPHGPGGIPQPTTGEVFYDPIADAQKKLEMKTQLTQLREMQSTSRNKQLWDPQEGRIVQRQAKFARGGIVRAESERAYQGGGTVDEIIARTTNPEPGETLTKMLVKGATAPEDRTQLIIRNRDDAMARLRAGQKGIAERRAQQQKRDKSAKWLAFAQGMLAPTQTGSFGESVGATAGLMGQEMELARQHEGERIEEEMLLAGQEQDIYDDYIDQLQTEARLQKGYTGEYSRTRPIGTDKLYPHPEDRTKLARGQQIWDPDIPVPKFNDDGTPMLDENGEQVIGYGDTRLTWIEARGPDGSIPFAASPLEVERARQLALNKELGAAEGERINNDIQSGRDAWPMIQKFERAMGLLKQVEREGRGTGGYVELMQKFAEWWGVDTSEVTTMGEIRHALGQAVLDGLKHFPGQISEGERKYMERLETGLAKPLGVNMGILEEGLRIQRNRLRRGLVAARFVGSPIDLLAMGIDPNAPPGTAPAGSIEGARTQVAGSTRNNPIVVGPGIPMPPAGTWIQLPPPSGEVRRWEGLPENEVSPDELVLTGGQ